MRRFFSHCNPTIGRDKMAAQMDFLYQKASLPSAPLQPDQRSGQNGSSNGFLIPKGFPAASYIGVFFMSFIMYSCVYIKSASWSLIFWSEGVFTSVSARLCMRSFVTPFDFIVFRTRRT